MIYLNATRWDMSQFWHLLRNNGEIEQAWKFEFFAGPEWFALDDFFRFSLAYFIIDVLWLFIQPEAFKIPATIFVHHIIVLVYLYFVYTTPRYFWFMGATLFVEINTWIMIARRQVFLTRLSKLKPLYFVIEVLFYGTGAVRVIWFIYLLKYEIYVYGRDYHLYNTPYNIVFWGIINQVGLVVMSLHHSIIMAMNLLKTKPTDQKEKDA